MMKLFCTEMASRVTEGHILFREMDRRKGLADLGSGGAGGLGGRERGGKFWSARAGFDHRALAVQDWPDVIWVWIGSHDAYRRLLKLLG